MNHNISIIIPVYNNPKTIKKVVEDALFLNIFVIVIDDGSDIKVETLLKKDKNLTILRDDKNQGKGVAILTGTKEAKKRGFSYVISIDGDGQHYPQEVLKLLPLLKDENIVIGNRAFKENVPNTSKFGRQFSNFWIWTESGEWLKDTQSGFRAYPISILDLELTQSRYDLEIEVLVKHLWSGKKIKEVAIEVYYPPKGARISHFDKVEDNIRLSKIHTRLFFLNILRGFGVFKYHILH
jgi:glycosyltransferase involved in cell wall biosynthesis